VIGNSRERGIDKIKEVSNFTGAFYTGLPESLRKKDRKLARQYGLYRTALYREDPSRPFRAHHWTGEGDEGKQCETPVRDAVELRLVDRRT